MLKLRNLIRPSNSRFLSGRYISNKATVVNEEDETIITSTKKATETEMENFSLFPWRERPKKETNFLSEIFSDIQFSYLDADNRTSRFTHKNLSSGAYQAFLTSVSAIFNNESLKPIENTSETKKETENDDTSNNSSDSQPIGESKKSETIQDDKITINDIFEPELAEFYHSAIFQFSDSNKFKVVHNLIDVFSVKIVSKNIIFSGMRGVRDKSSLRKVQNLGRNRIIDISKMVEINDFTDPVKVAETLMKNANRPVLDEFSSSATVQIFVDFGCTEIFFVGDKDTNEVLQGSMLPKQTVHQLLLECVIAPRKGERYLEIVRPWQVVDIDNWLNENKFWTEDEEI